jgi:hypothetical protein
VRNFLMGSDVRETFGDATKAVNNRARRMLGLFLAMEWVARCQADEAAGCVEGFVGDGYYQNRDNPEHRVSFVQLVDW